jgi:hypothetical protein
MKWTLLRAEDLLPMIGIMILTYEGLF